MKSISIDRNGVVVFRPKSDNRYYNITPTPSSRERVANLFNAYVEDTQLTNHGEYFTFVLFWYSFKHEKVQEPEWMTEARAQMADAKDLERTQEDARL